MLALAPKFHCIAAFICFDFHVFAGLRRLFWCFLRPWGNAGWTMHIPYQSIWDNAIQIAKALRCFKYSVRLLDILNFRSARRLTRWTGINIDLQTVFFVTQAVLPSRVHFSHVQLHCRGLTFSTCITILGKTAPVWPCQVYLISPLLTHY